MCTSFNFKQGYYGRNMDLEYPLPSSRIIITPIGYDLKYRHLNKNINIKYPMIGMGMVVENYPLYYDAMNSEGLYMAGLNFNTFAHFNDVDKTKENITTFELVLHVLGQAKNVKEAKELIKDINLTNTQFNQYLGVGQLHWLICDTKDAIVLECTKDGLKIYDNPLGVLTNNPTFDYHLLNINNYININPRNATSDFSENIELRNFSQGVGTTGLPGGLSSVDRFIRCTYTKMTSMCDDNEIANVTQVFHILSSVSITTGTVLCEDDKIETTLSSSCASKSTLSYYYKVYTNNQINCVSMNNVDLNNNKQLYVYDLERNQDIKYINAPSK